MFLVRVIRRPCRFVRVLALLSIIAVCLVLLKSRAQTTKALKKVVTDDEQKVCVVPKLDINAPALTKFLHSPEPLKCDENESNWAVVENGKFIILEDTVVLMFRRKMKESTKYLIEQLNAVILEGYNIVGDGTPQAFIPILTSGTEEELPLTRKRYGAKANYVDIYPMIWKNFSDNGYVTLYGEDTAALGMFSYRLKGFKQQPTDHYFRTFFQMSETVLPSRTCIGSEPQFKVWFRYGEEFFDHYPRDIPKFALLHHGEFSHNDANTVDLVDPEFSAHLARMHKKGHLNNTLLIVMADHGHRFAKFRKTHQGQLEERLPFFALAAPAWFRESARGKLAWDNLLINKERLSTPFDIYSTLMDLLNFPNDQELRSQQDYANKRSLSLWKEVPKQRTCEQAGVQNHWCTCLRWAHVPSKHQHVIKVAKSLVYVINAETEPERRLCSALSLQSVESAKMMITNRDVLRYKDVRDPDGFVPNLDGHTKLSFAIYQVRLRTMPGNALYEATCRYDLDTGSVTVDFGAISHINPYGDDPHCIIDRNFFLAAYCVCYDRIHSHLNNDS